MGRYLPAMGPLFVVLTLAMASATFADAPSPQEGERFTLRYQFHAGEILRWNVVHRYQIRTSVSDTTQTAETNSISVKAWWVKEVSADGTATFEHLVESVDMRQKLTGRDEVRYNSQTDKHVPQGFEDVARAVGVPLSVVTIDPKGKVIHRKRNPVKASVANEGPMTVQLPDEPVAVGSRWTSPQDIDVAVPGGGIRKVKAMQTFTLDGVKTGVATIRVDTQVLTPIHDPALESQVMQYETSGIVRFDLDAGRILSQQMDVDKGAVGFRGEASSIRYISRFTEEFLPPQAKVAARTARKD
jgi:hypothetical protein